MSRKKDKFAATIFTKLEEDGEEHYYVCTENLNEIAEPGKSILVGVYKLFAVKTMTSRVETFFAPLARKRGR